MAPSASPAAREAAHSNSGSQPRAPAAVVLVSAALQAGFCHFRCRCCTGVSDWLATATAAAAAAPHTCCAAAAGRGNLPAHAPLGHAAVSVTGGFAEHGAIAAGAHFAPTEFPHHMRREVCNKTAVLQIPLSIDLLQEVG